MDLPVRAAAVLSYLAGGPMRDSPRWIDDAAASIGHPPPDIREALDWLVARGLIISQDVDEKPDGVTGRRGCAFRLTRAGERALDQ